ncbi:hypothetical protein H5202_16565 [Shewanella sp. SG41-4]|uniref:hypothetical protein n=1 Tax=Shewanella sp. SG41-4 TaxID=2760976 RepID=UPI0016004CEA|nr:hypothetical protein [Shewanella sp. SG41-4]MBB1440258.1 hypothetical protein [Shewanella sp. SG41-4]
MIQTSVTSQPNSANVSTADIRQDPLISKLLNRLPQDIAESYTDTQLLGIKQTLGPKVWGGHFIVNRGTFKIPFIKWRFYYVFLLGKNKRAYTRREKKISVAMLLLSIVATIIVLMLFGLLLVYLLKSALGIDLFPEMSLGIWDQFKQLFG